MNFSLKLKLASCILKITKNVINAESFIFPQGSHAAKSACPVTAFDKGTQICNKSRGQAT